MNSAIMAAEVGLLLFAIAAEVHPLHSASAPQLNGFTFAISHIRWGRGILQTETEN